LDEISGIAAGIASPGVVYVHNDGGDSARFFALDARSGAVLAVYSVPGATNVDWEDIAVAPDADGTPSVWLADIGDNDASREQIRLYRVDEPHVDRAAHSLALTSSPAQAWRLRYPDGAHDAESLAVSPDGVPYIVTKSLLGASVVYAAPSRPAGVQVLREIGAIGFGITGTTTPFGPVGDLTATGADISRAGDRLVVRTYGDAYFFTIRNGDVAAALRTPPERVALPRQPQGEGICFDGNRVLVDSEKVGSAVYAVPTPPVTTPPTVTGRATSPTAAGPESARPSQATSASGADAGPADTSHTSGWWWVVVGAGFATAGAALAAVVRRRRETAGTP
jgi:hypothetical protein